MKNYVTKEALSEIVSDLMDVFVDDPRNHVTVSLGRFNGDIHFEVRVQDSAQDFRSVFAKDYMVVDEPLGSYDITNAISDALEKVEKEVPTKVEEQ